MQLAVPSRDALRAVSKKVLKVGELAWALAISKPLRLGVGANAAQRHHINARPPNQHPRVVI